VTTRTAGAAVAALANADQAQAMLRDLLPQLSPLDVFRGIVPITFGEHRYELAALSMEEDERWIASLDGSLRSLLEGVQAGEEDPAALMAVLMTATPRLLDAVIAYDRDGILPPRDELRRQGRAIDALRAAVTIWVATNPTLAAAVMGLQAAATTTQATPAPSSSSPRPGAGRRARRGKG